MALQIIQKFGLSIFGLTGPTCIPNSLVAVLCALLNEGMTMVGKEEGAVGQRQQIVRKKPFVWPDIWTCFLWHSHTAGAVLSTHWPLLSFSPFLSPSLSFLSFEYPLVMRLFGFGRRLKTAGSQLSGCLVDWATLLELDARPGISSLSLSFCVNKHQFYDWPFVMSSQQKK